MAEELPFITTTDETKQLIKPKGTLATTGLKSLQSVTEESVRRSALGELAPISSRLQGGFLTSLVDRIADTLAGIGRWLGFDKLFKVGEQFRDGQLALNDAVDLLSPLLDYGSVYMNSAHEWNNEGILPFNQQIGPMRGCALEEKGIRLHDKGQWDVIAAVTASWVRIATSEVSWRVIVKDPEGTIFSQRRFTVSNANNITMTLPFTVVVPAEGYLVQVEVTRVGRGREIIGGSTWNSLTVKHITRDTDKVSLDQGETALGENPDGNIVGTAEGSETTGGGEG